MLISYEGRKLTSKRGRILLPSAEMALHSKVMAKNTKKIWYVSACQISLPSSFWKTLTQATKNRAVPKFTAKVIVILPTT